MRKQLVILSILVFLVGFVFGSFTSPARAGTATIGLDNLVGVRIIDAIASGNWTADNWFVNGNPRLYRNGASFWEFENTLAQNDNVVGAVGMLGNPEMNVSYNMNYTNTGTHDYYDSSHNALWTALGDNAWAIQAAPPGVTPDIWTNSGNNYLLYMSYSFSGSGLDTKVIPHMVIGTRVSQVNGTLYDATLTVPRVPGHASIAGETELVLVGNQVAGIPGDIYLNSYNTGDVWLAVGGGGVHVGVPSGEVGFFGRTPISKPTGVAVDTAAIHAALVNLGLIAGP